MGLSSTLLAEAYEGNWFKIFVAKKFGGLESSLPNALEIIRNCNSKNGSLGWCVNLGAGANYFSGFFSLKGAQTVFQDPKCVLAGSGGLATTVESTKGGYLVTGEWPKATGSNHATYFTCNVKLPNGEVVSLAMKANEIEIIEDWQLFGMKQSSSFGFKTSKAFVPNEMIFRIDHPVLESGYAIHRLPFICFAQFSMTAAIIGLAQGIVANLKKDLVKENAQVALKNLEENIEEYKAQMNKLSVKQWEVLQTDPKLVDSDKIEELVKKTGRALYNSVANLYFEAGLVMADENNPVHESYKDFMTAIQHSLFK